MLCSVCGEKIQVRYDGGRDYFKHAVDDEFKILYCPKCKLGFCWPMDLSQDYLYKCYPDDYDAYKRQSTIMDLLQEIMYNLDIILLQKYCFFDRLKINDVFEIGAGRGQFLNTIRKKMGVTISGVEMNKGGVKNAKEFYDVDLTCSTMEYYEFLQQYDVIIMRHVLEHTNYFVEILQKIYNYGLKEKGILFIKIPCMDSFSEKRFGKYWFGYDMPRHRVAFSEEGIRNILHNIGYKDIKCIREVVPSISDYSVQFRNKEKVYKKEGISRIFRYLFIEMFLIFKKKEADRIIVLARKSSE